VRTRQPVLGRGAKVVPITLDQVVLTLSLSMLRSNISVLQEAFCF
jgi:hypothetical protein